MGGITKACEGSGGGDHNAIRLDTDFHHGATGETTLALLACLGYLTCSVQAIAVPSPVLVELGHFTCLCMEVQTLSHGNLDLMCNFELQIVWPIIRLQHHIFPCFIFPCFPVGALPLENV